ncbi:prepilin-type N-terminal cleavage/methylation domain-containing protein [Patescibacteria group bacterium]|nr:prepilin-type N-terminal cleavage/methylation domain-containing protein [Patescibacteria group bacterium]
MKKNFKKNRQGAMPTGRQGFSLVEVLLVVFILSTALTVFIQVISQSIVHSIESQDSIIAAGLAQEGVELIKNIRDNNWAKKRTTFNPSYFPSDGDCRIDYDSTCSSSVSYNLKFGNDFYNHALGLETKFFRKININTVGSTRVVNSYVVWGRPDFPALDSCSPSNKCVYATITLTQWGGE